MKEFAVVQGIEPAAERGDPENAVGIVIEGADLVATLNVTTEVLRPTRRCLVVPPCRLTEGTGKIRRQELAESILWSEGAGVDQLACSSADRCKRHSERGRGLCVEEQ